MSPWSHCPVTCDGGVQKRTVWCENEKRRERVPDAECLILEKPSSIRECNVAKCKAVTLGSDYYQWYAGKWSPVRAARRRLYPK
ncbi:unnamed protein product [Gongylonema pulchrum]|uniref:TSP1_spondin domain-containing protein n=1 Tax=Gongylonema pulchrum TaxID=637853 RepID=A0A183EUX6_9BILA|nr:unnamed protein product [Gongylonema pulchrum]